MFILNCKNMGMDCDYVARAATKEEVMEQLRKHASHVHPDAIKKMESMSEEEVREMMMKNIIEE